MKKLLITSMAAVAVSICAKAAFTDSSENFESTNIGPLFSQGDEGQYIVDRSKWSTAATPDDGVFTVTNITDITTKAGYTLADGNTKALAIDTSASLMRNAVTSGDASQTGYVMTGDESIFFDSLVQFTATESIPTPSTGDKLVIGLFADEDPEVNADLGDLDNATNLVVISAVLNQNGEIVANATNIIDNTDLNVGPEEWHRLTIQVMNNSGFDPNGDVKVPGFKVFVDKKEVKVNGDNKIFHSLVKFVNSGNVLKGVAFEGKGAVDDLVFTTTDPFAGGGGEDPDPEPEAGKFTLKFTMDAAEAAEAAVLYVVADETDVIEDGDGDGSFILGVDVKSVVAKIICGSGYKVTGATASTEEGEEDMWILPVDVTSAVAGGEITCNVEVVEDSGDEPGTDDPDPETPTVDPTSGTLSAEVAGDEDADPGAIAAKVTISISAADTDAGVTADYFKKTAEYDYASSKWVVTVALDETVVQPSADEALENVAAALTGDGTTVSITYTGNAIKPGLYYGLAAAGDLTALKTAVPASFARATKDAGVVLSADKPDGNAGFFKVVISATNPNPVQE